MFSLACALGKASFAGRREAMNKQTDRQSPLERVLRERIALLDGAMGT